MARRLPIFLQGDEPEKLLAATRTERDRVLLMVMLYLGLRVSEACKLQVAHVDFGRKLLMVREGKGSKDRALPLPKRFAGILRGWIGGRTDGYVFPSRQGKGRLSNRAVQLLVKRIVARAGLVNGLESRRVTPHKFRHAFATRMLERCRDLIAVRDAMGHASVATTQIYTHASQEHLRASMEI